MIELFTWPTPNGRKASIALEEFELDYEVRAVDITKDEQFAPSFLNISPNNKIPALVDHESGRTLMESGAILIYLADRCERFWGEDRYQTIEWLMLQMGGVGPMLGQAHHFLKYNKGKAPYAENVIEMKPIDFTRCLIDDLNLESFYLGAIRSRIWRRGLGFRGMSGRKLILGSTLI